MSKELIERFPEINYSNYDHDDVHVLQNWALEAIDELTKQAERIEKLRTRLSAQTHQTQITAQQIHDAVLAAIKRGTTFPDGIDEQGHPIEQLVGMIVTTLQLKLDEQAERVTALEQLLRLIQWSGWDIGGNYCPECGASPSRGHTKSCKLAAVLKDSTGGKQ